MSIRDTYTKTLLASAAITAAGQGSSFNVEHYIEGTVYVKVTAKSGTSPTLDFDIESSHDDADWHKHSDVPQVNDPTIGTGYMHTVHQITGMGKWIRISYPNPGGSDTPSLTCEVVVVLKN